jgi:hypothetical protein
MTVDARLWAMVEEAVAVARGEAPDRPDDPAVHEAAHAVAAIALGGRVRSVTIADAPPGAAGHCAGVTIPSRLPQARVRAGAVAWAGGVAAGHLLRSGRDMDVIVGLFGTVAASLPAGRLSVRVVEANRELIDELAGLLRERGTVGWAELAALYEPPPEAVSGLGRPHPVSVRACVRPPYVCP